MKILKKISLIIIGIILSLVILEFGLQLAGFTLTTIKKFQNKVSKDPNTITILCLGESTTDKQWPPILQKILDEKSKNKKFNVIDGGVGGIRTDSLLTEFKNRYLYENNIDIVISMIGINDTSYIVKQINDTKFKTISLFILIKHHLISTLNKHIKTNNEIKYTPNKSYEYNLNKIQEFTNNKNYDKALEIAYSLYISYPKKKKEIFKAIECPSKNSGKIDLYVKILIDIIKEDPSFQPLEVIEILARTTDDRSLKSIEELKKLYPISIEELKKLYPINDKENLNKFVETNIQDFFDIRNILVEENLNYIVKEIDNVILNIDYKKKILDKYDLIKLLGYKALNLFINKNYDEAEKIFKEQNKYILKYTSKSTINNYLELNKICKINNIRLIAMQYPIRSINLLKEILKNCNNVIVVSNEENFKQALQKYKEQDIFTDRFAGDFGHCTNLGNTLIAENVAETILKLYN